jgi:chitosanase
MLSPVEKLAAQAIVNVFETSSARGNYSKVTVIDGDAGHLTYGRSQTTLASGLLYELVRDYCAADGAVHADALRPFLGQLQARDTALDHDEEIKVALRRAGGDPVMQAVQDAFFDSKYWDPAVRDAEAMGFVEPLSVAVIYDSRIHGSWLKIRDRTSANHGEPLGVGERAWIGHYVAERRAWFAGFPTTNLLHKSTRRMDAFRALIELDRWNLALPFSVRGIRIDEVSLGLAPPPPRDLDLRDPPIEGQDVVLLQQALRDAGCYTLVIDGVFGSKTEGAVRTFQKAKSLKVDGVVGPNTRAALGLG